MEGEDLNYMDHMYILGLQTKENVQTPQKTEPTTPPGKLIPEPVPEQCYQRSHLC